MAKASGNSRSRVTGDHLHARSDGSVEAGKALALEILIDAWEAALEEEIAPEILASSAIFVALTDMIENHGEEFVAQMAEGLPARIRAGEFTLVHQSEPKV